MLYSMTRDSTVFFFGLFHIFSLFHIHQTIFVCSWDTNISRVYRIIKGGNTKTKITIIWSRYQSKECVCVWVSYSNKTKKSRGKKFQIKNKVDNIHTRTQRPSTAPSRSTSVRRNRRIQNLEDEEQPVVCIHHGNNCCFLETFFSLKCTKVEFFFAFYLRNNHTNLDEKEIFFTTEKCMVG